MADFLSLPAEIRVSIYKYCFAVGTIFPYQTEQLEQEQMEAYKPFHNTPATPQSLPAIEVKRTPNSPFLALLLVCKKIYTEATPIIYQSNKVVLPTAALSARFFSHCLTSTEKRLWLKDVELELCASDLPLEEKEDLSGAIESYVWHHTFSSAHDTWKHHLAQIIWPRKLSPILNDTALTTLTINFGNSKCPFGCCYMDVAACAAFRPGFAHGMPKHISLHHLPTCHIPDPESNTLKDGIIAGVDMPIVSNEEGQVDVDLDVERYAVQVAEQIARWTRAREMGVSAGRGTRMWFEAAVEEEEEKEVTSDDDDDGTARSSFLSRNDALAMAALMGRLDLGIRG